MESQTHQTFIEEASAEIPVLRRGILSLAQAGSRPSDVLPLRETAASMRAGAMGCEMPNVARSASELESALSALAAADWKLTQMPIATLLDRLASLEESILQNYLSDSASSIDVSAFVDESFDSLQCADISAPDQARDESDNLFGFEIDDELLEVFALEADSLLKSMEAGLEAMSRDPNDRDALWSIRRSAHTFKGAAGIVGLKKPSELAHRIEDLLDRIAENDFAASVSLFDVLRQSIDCLQAMTNGDTSMQLSQRIAETYHNFDCVLAALSQQPTSVPAESIAAAEAEITGVSQSDELQPKTEPVPDCVPAPPSYRKRSIVRVSVESLDHFARITRDLLIDRSVFDQRLKDLETQIEELHNAARRLQATCGKFEINFEASMLGSPTASAKIVAADHQTAARGRSGSFDELEFDRYTEFHQSTRQLSEAASDTVAIGSALDEVRSSFETLFRHHRRLVEEMQESLTAIRMAEFGSLATRLQRVVTVTCEETGKRARLTIKNANQQLDTRILESLAEPLMHLLKNAVVHGIEPPDIRRMLGKPETGQIVLNVADEVTHIVLAVCDDGRGIGLSALREKAVKTGKITRAHANSMNDSELCDLMFMPGLTTAEELNLSAGRGVGMSIIKESLEAGRGQISVESFPQKGALFTIRVPLAAAVTTVLLVRAGCQTLAVPLKLITRITELTDKDVAEKPDGQYVETEDAVLPLMRLSELIGFTENVEGPRQFFNVLQIETGGKTWLVGVDEILRTEDVVIKPLGRPLENIKTVVGAAILGSGELVAVLDMPHLLNLKLPLPVPAKSEPAVTPIAVMVVDDSPSVRHMTSKILAADGFIVTTAKDGIDALEQLKASSRLPDIILSDIEMPRMDGYEFVSTMRRSDDLANMPVIMITSRGGTKHREKAFECGVSEFATKPFEENELISMIERLVRAVP